MQAKKSKTKESLFTRSELAKMFNVPHDAIRRWIDKEFITPTQEGTTGIPHLFAWPELRNAALFKKLIRIGICQEEAAEFTKSAADSWFEVEEEDKRFLVFDLIKMEIRAACPLEEIATPVQSILKSGAQALVIIDAKRVLTDLEEKIAKL